MCAPLVPCVCTSVMQARANKLQLSVNFMPGTPCYERVVEMQVCAALVPCVCMSFMQARAYKLQSSVN